MSKGKRRSSADFDLLRLRDALAYDPETGEFRWKTSGPKRTAGAKAGHVAKSGYVILTAANYQVTGHRLAWAFVYGEIPTFWIDHINGVRSDNRIANLRAATPSQNLANRGVRKDSASGIKGVYQNKRTGKWEARIAVGGFATAEEAAAEHARLTASAWGPFGRSDGVTLDALRSAARGLDRTLDRGE
jgi:hypothetical protein